MCMAAPGRGLNSMADLGAGMSYYVTGKTLDAPNGYSPSGTPLPAAGAAAGGMASTVAPAGGVSPANALKRRTPTGAPQGNDLLTPAFTAGSPGYKQLTGL